MHREEDRAIPNKIYPTLNFEWGQFKGIEVNSKNRTEVLKDLLQKHQSDHPGTPMRESEIYCKRVINREIKHRRAWLAGKQFFHYMGVLFQVDTDVARSFTAANSLRDKVFDIHNVNSEEE